MFAIADATTKEIMSETVTISRVLLEQILDKLREATDDYTADSNERWHSPEMNAIIAKVEDLLAAG